MTLLIVDAAEVSSAGTSARANVITGIMAKPMPTPLNATMNIKVLSGVVMSKEERFQVMYPVSNNPKITGGLAPTLS
jgi:hypothetical protein